MNKHQVPQQESITRRQLTIILKMVLPVTLQPMQRALAEKVQDAKDKLQKHAQANTELNKR